jgi:hypothetical protein
MAREAKLYASSSGSVVRGFLKFRANIPPRWIKNARTSRKRVEPEIVRALGTLKRLQKTRPGARERSLARSRAHDCGCDDVSLTDDAELPSFRKSSTTTASSGTAGQER